MTSLPFDEGDEVYLDFSAQGKRKATYEGRREDKAGNDVHVFEVVPGESTFESGHKEPLYPQVVERYIDEGRIYSV